LLKTYVSKPILSRAHVPALILLAKAKDRIRRRSFAVAAMALQGSINSNKSPSARLGSGFALHEPGSPDPAALGFNYFHGLPVVSELSSAIQAHVVGAGYGRRAGAPLARLTGNGERTSIVPALKEGVEQIDHRLTSETADARRVALMKSRLGRFPD
jgi:hypothetical protein